MNEEIWKIPYSLVKNDWDLLQRYLEFKGNPRYIIVGDVILRYRDDISDLGNLVGVEGELNLEYSRINLLGKLEFVDGYFSLYGCKKIKTLGKLKKVKRTLQLTNSSIESLGELEFVGEALLLSGCKNIKTLGKLKKVVDRLYLDLSSIESLGELEFVGEDLLIRYTNIPQSELNNVEVGGKIHR